MNNSFDSVLYVNNVIEDLIFQYNRACQATTPSLVGGSREKAARDKFAMLLPNRIGVGTGCIIDTTKYSSNQTDIVLYEKDFCPNFSINETPEATYFPCEGVIAVGELKSTLDSLQLDDSFKKIKSVKQCTRFVPNSLVWRSYNSSIVIEGAEIEQFNQKTNFRDQIYGFILCKKFGLSISTLLDKISEKCKTEPVHLLPNLIVSMEEGMIFFVDKINNSLTEDKKGATGLYFTPNNGNSIQFLLNKIYNITIGGRTTDKIPLDKYLIATSTIDTNGGIYKEFN